MKKSTEKDTDPGYEPEETINSTEEETSPNEEENASEETNQPTKEEQLELKLAELNNKYLRLYSDFENFRKRTAKEKLDLIAAANQDLLQKILPVVDDFERAITSNKDTEDTKALREGFDLIFSKLTSILASQGVKPMESIGKPFDVEFHEAITNIPAPNKSMKGKVVDVTEKGYFYNDKVLRYAKVVVGA